MPTSSLATAFLLAAERDKLGVWTSPEWRTQTSCQVPPYSRDFVPNKEVNAATHDKIATFAENFWNQPEGERAAYADTRLVDQNSAGRAAWKKWFVERWPKWKVYKIIDDILLEVELIPHMAATPQPDGTYKVNH